MAFRAPLLKPSEKGERRISTPRANGRSMAKVSHYEIVKDKIKTWCENRFKVGELLAELQRDKLYKEEYETFEECCLAEFGLKTSHAYGLIEAAGVKGSLKLSDMSDKITNPRQAAALAPVPVAQREKVIKEVVERGPVTAKAITEVAQTITRPMSVPASKPEPEKRYDKTGYLIPDPIWEDWQRAEEFSEHLRGLSRLKKIISDGLDEGDLIFRELNNGAVSMLKNIYGELKCVIPYAVCSTCSGRTPDKCVLCKGRGFLSEFAWNQFVPASIKTIRKKMAEPRK